LAFGDWPLAIGFWQRLVPPDDLSGGLLLPLLKISHLEGRRVLPDWKDWIAHLKR
jgi:hypothetical protein